MFQHSNDDVYDGNTYGWILAEDEEDDRKTDLLAILLNPVRNMVWKDGLRWLYL